MKKISKLLALLLVLVMVLSCAAGCKGKTTETPDAGATTPAATNPTPGNPANTVATYTYRDYATQLGSNWNPLNWKTEGDSQILQYLQTPLVTPVALSTEEGTFQWAYKAAASITDVTAANKADLSKYGASTGSVFEIKLNENMKWQDGSAITADDYIFSMQALLDPAAKNAQVATFTTGDLAMAGAAKYSTGAAAEFGCYKVDELTIRYVTANKVNINDFLLACGTNWLVHKATYEANAAAYGTTLETTVSYGPYKLESVDAGKVVLVQNENYYQFTKNADGTLYGETDYEVDGEKLQAYQTTKIIIAAMTEEEAQAAFMKGELSKWIPNDEELVNYNTSEQLRQEDKTETYALFFNTNEAALKAMDTKGNKNSVVLTNANFRKAFSMAIDRGDWVSVTPAYKAAYYLLNQAYYYDVYKDPTSVYRDAAQTMQSMCDVYGVKWVDGAMYGTLEEAYGSISGYYPEDAKNLMVAACNELVQAGLYTKGQEIKIRVAYSTAAITASQQEQVAKLNEYLNAVASGSGFGKITLEAVGEIADITGKVTGGEFAIGYGAAGGDVFNPLTALKSYLDASANKLAEGACWNPATEKLTLKIEGESITKTWTEWIRTLEPNGEFANKSIGYKLDVTSALERELLKKFYRIPLAADCDAYMQAYQVQDFAEQYNVMYGFGGMELLTFNYNDAQWAEQVAKGLGYE